MQIKLNIQANNETAGDDEWESSYVTETEYMRRIAKKNMFTMIVCVFHASPRVKRESLIAIALSTVIL